MAPHGYRRATVVAAVGSGQAELRPDPAYEQAWTLFVDAVRERGAAVVRRSGRSLVSRVLPAPAGVELVVADARAHLEDQNQPGYAVVVATLRSAFADVAVLAEDAMVRGRKAGTTILVAADTLSDLPVRAGALHGEKLNTFCAGARARLDEPA